MSKKDHHKKSKKKKKEKKKKKDRDHEDRERRRHHSSGSRDRYYSRHRDRRLSPSPLRFDKKKILEIAKSNLAAIQASTAIDVVSIRSVETFQPVSTVLSAAKNVSDLVDYCKKLCENENNSTQEHVNQNELNLERHPFRISEAKVS